MTNNTKISKNDLNLKLDLILKNQKKILKNEKKILGEEEKIENFEKKELKTENLINKNEKNALNELKELEKQLKNNNYSPIKNITKRDILKGFIGAFVGIMGHFSFSKATEIADHLNIMQATLLYIVAFIMIIIMLYYTGFRKVEKHIVLKFMPLRAFILYTVSIITILIVDILFGKINLGMSINEIYVLVGTTIILAVMGAGTADLIGGGNEEK